MGRITRFTTKKHTSTQMGNTVTWCAVPEAEDDTFQNRLDRIDRGETCHYLINDEFRVMTRDTPKQRSLSYLFGKK